MSVTSCQPHPGHILKIPSMTYVYREPTSLRQRTEALYKAASRPRTFIVSSDTRAATSTLHISSIMNSAIFSVILTSHILLSTISAMVLPSQLSQEPEYFVLPSTQVHFENSYDKEKNEAYPDDYSPTNEEILEALLSQLDYPEESEKIYDSLMKREDETLSHQLSFLKESEQDIDDRKVLNRRRKRSIPPFVQSKKLRSGMH